MITSSPNIETMLAAQAELSWALQSGRAISDTLPSQAGVERVVLTDQELSFREFEIAVRDVQNRVRNVNLISRIGHKHRDAMRTLDVAYGNLQERMDLALRNLVATQKRSAVPAHGLRETADPGESSSRPEDEAKGIRQRLANDDLTGLPNRAQLLESIDLALREVAQKSGHVGLIHIDLDDFQNVNDYLGHGVGDHLLRAYATRIKKVTSNNSSVFRSGGDEYTVLVKDTNNSEGLVDLAKRLVVVIEKPVELPEGYPRVVSNEVRVTASVGVAFSSPGASNVDNFLRDAELALDEAKTAGGSAVEVFREELRARRSIRSERSATDGWITSKVHPHPPYLSE